MSRTDVYGIEHPTENDQWSGEWDEHIRLCLACRDTFPWSAVMADRTAGVRGPEPRLRPRAPRQPPPVLPQPPLG